MRRKDLHEKRRVRQIIFVCLLLGSMLFFLFATTGKKEFSMPHKLGLEMIGSLQGFTTFFSKTGADLFKDYIALWDVRRENEQLREEIRSLKETNQEYREAAATNIRLHKLLQMKERLPTPSVSADIIGKDPSLWSHTLIIDRGRKDGLKKGMPAITEDGVTGQVVDTSAHYSKILLAIDPNSAINVLVQRSRMQGILKGDGEGFELDYVLKNVDVQEGDTIVTSGFGDFFPKGLPVGTVSKTVISKRGMFQKITVAPTVDFSKLEVVLILLAESSATE
jgi:rod shape-determining protein MreC